jgi:hypothetical protein
MYSLHVISPLSARRGKGKKNFNVLVALTTSARQHALNRWAPNAWREDLHWFRLSEYTEELVGINTTERHGDAKQERRHLLFIGERQAIDQEKWASKKSIGGQRDSNSNWGSISNKKRTWSSSLASTRWPSFVGFHRHQQDELTDRDAQVIETVRVPPARKGRQIQGQESRFTQRTMVVRPSGHGRSSMSSRATRVRVSDELYEAGAAATCRPNPSNARCSRPSTSSR